MSQKLFRLVTGQGQVGGLDERRERARRRARRAAQVATIGLALMGGCGEHHEQILDDDRRRRQAEDAEPAWTADAELVRDADADDAKVIYDSAVVRDAAVARDAAGDECDVFRDFEQGINTSGELRERCCNEQQRWSDPEYPGCYPWGPYVPPSEEAIPSSRSPQIRVAVEAALRNVA